MFFRKKSKPAAPPQMAAPTPVMRAPVAPAPVMDASGEPDLRGLISAVWRKKVTIIGFTLLAAAGAFVIVNAITPRYRSESKLLLESRENVFMRADADKNTAERGNIDPVAVTSQIQLVTSRDLAREVITKEKLNEMPEFDPALGGLSLGRTLLGMFGMARDVSALSRDERTLEAYYDRLNVHAIENSRVIAIDFSSASPELASNVANTIADFYLSMQRSAKTDQTRAASSWLAGEIEKMRAKVAAAEAKVEEYRSKSNLFVGSNNTSLPNQQLTEINSQIAAARGQKADLEARARQLRELVRSGAPIDSSDIANSESMRRLTEQGNALRSQLAEQSTTLHRSASAHQGIARPDRRNRTRQARRGRTSGAPARQRRQSRRRSPADADGEPRPGQEARFADQRAGRAIAFARARCQIAARIAGILSGEIFGSFRARQHQRHAAGGAHHFARQPGDPAGLSEENRDCPDCRIRGVCFVGRLHRDECAARDPGGAGGRMRRPIRACRRTTPMPVGYRAPQAFAQAPPLQQPLPYMASPPTMPAPQFMAPLALSSIEQIAHSIMQAGEGGRRIAVAGTKTQCGHDARRHYAGAGTRQA